MADLSGQKPRQSEPDRGDPKDDARSFLRAVGDSIPGQAAGSEAVRLLGELVVDLDVTTAALEDIRAITRRDKDGEVFRIARAALVAVER